MKDQIVDAAVKASPPITLALWNHIADVPAEKWLTYLAITYAILQIVVLVRKEFFKRRANRAGR